MNAVLHERARLVRERALIRGWEYRQRHYSKGVWRRFQRVLVDAAQAWILEESEADWLEVGGHVPLPIGRELNRPLRVFWLTGDELAAMAAPRRVAVRLCVELLQARSLALVKHVTPAPPDVPSA